MGNHACITAETSHTGFVLESLAFSDRNSFDMTAVLPAKHTGGGTTYRKGMRKSKRTDDHS